MTTPATGSALQNTDRLIWENINQDVGYRDHVSVTQNDAILICSGGYCIGKTPKEWCELAWPSSERGLNKKKLPYKKVEIRSLQKHCQELEEEKDKYKRTLEYLLHQSGEKDGNIGEYEMKLIERCLAQINSPKPE